MRLPRISPAALGFRAMPSTAALSPRACPRAPNAAANASAKPAVMIDHRTTSMRVPAAAAASCACSGATNPRARTMMPTVTKKRLLTDPPSAFGYQLLAIDYQLSAIGHRLSRSDFSRRHFTVLLVLMLGGHRAAQVDHGQQHENERLQRSGDDPEKHHRQRHEERDDAEQNQDHEILAEDVAEEPQRQ